MNVRELIECLQRLPQDMVVMEVCDESGVFCEKMRPPMVTKISLVRQIVFRRIEKEPEWIRYWEHERGKVLETKDVVEI
jgi:hypothetical protein